MSEPLCFPGAGHGLRLATWPNTRTQPRAASQESKTTDAIVTDEFQTLDSTFVLSAAASLAPWSWSLTPSFQAPPPPTDENIHFQPVYTLTKESIFGSSSSSDKTGSDKGESGGDAEGIVQVYFDKTARLLMSVTLFASGFIIGPRGKTIRRIENFSRCQISSCIQEVKDGVKLRLFTFDGDLAAKNTAYRLVASAVTKYKALCETSRKGETVEHCHYISGVKFYYYPPPKAPNPTLVDCAAEEL